MKAITLLYHDMISPNNPEASGFGGADAAIYKLEVETFRQHLNAIRHVVPDCRTALEYQEDRHCPTWLTFDDGGVSAHQYTADMLEALGWRGHFFVTTNWIAKPGFLSPAQIRDLHRRGHVIGSHSCSHPERMSHCPPEQIRIEWQNSAAVLSEIIGEPVCVASVPGGYYRRNVAQGAAAAGIRILFTSEPRTSSFVVNECLVLGRYTIQAGVTPSTAAAIASGSIPPRYRQFAYWNLKKAAKIVGGEGWLRMRKWILANKHSDLEGSRGATP